MVKAGGVMRNGDLYFVTGRHIHTHTHVDIRCDRPKFTRNATVITAAIRTSHCKRGCWRSPVCGITDVNRMNGILDFGQSQPRSYRPIETTIPQEDSIVNYL